MSRTDDYSAQFSIDLLPVNRHFVNNPYKPASCKPDDSVCFSLVRGASSCHPDQTTVLVYGGDGILRKVPLRQRHGQ